MSNIFNIVFRLESLLVEREDLSQESLSYFGADAVALAVTMIEEAVFAVLVPAVGVRDFLI